MQQVGHDFGLDSNSFNKFGLDLHLKFNFRICYRGLILFRITIMATPNSHRDSASTCCCVSQNQPPATTAAAPIMLITVFDPAKTCPVILEQFIIIYDRFLR
jgi:hypothetical protein